MSEQSACYQLFPVELHNKIAELFDFLAYFPFEKPTHCVHCGSKSFYALCARKEKIANYRCNSCNKGFNRLTGTLFAHCRHVQLWRQFALGRLSGRTSDEIILSLGISQQAVRHRDKVLLQFLREEYPEIYQWWKPYQDRKKKRIKNSAVKQEAKALFNWLRTLTQAKEFICPNCVGKKMRKRATPRPHFVCDKCLASVNLLAETPLNRLAHIHLWRPFLELLIQGDSDSDISRKLAISLPASKKWRSAFMKVIREKQLNHLYEWVIWQRKRRTVQANRRSRKKQS